MLNLFKLISYRNLSPLSPSLNEEGIQGVSAQSILQNPKSSFVL